MLLSVAGTTNAILKHIESLGFVARVFRLQSSLHDVIPPSVEIHAVKLHADPAEQFLARISGSDDDEAVYRCACVLAEMVGIELVD